MKWEQFVKAVDSLAKQAPAEPASQPKLIAAPTATAARAK